MRTSRTALIALIAAIAVLSVAAVAAADVYAGSPVAQEGATDCPPNAECDPPPAGGGGMAMCAPDVPDCDDMIVDDPSVPDDGSSVPGWDGYGTPPDGSDDLGGAPLPCEPTEPDPNADPDTPVVGCVEPGPGDPDTGKPQYVEPTPGMADVRPIGFDDAVVADDDRSVTVTFWSGVEPCAVLDHVDVAYGAETVTITLFQGHDASAGDVACIEIAVLKATVVTLDQPLGGRTIVDGAA